MVETTENRKWLNTFLQLPTYAANVRSRFTLQQITNNIDNIKSDNNNSNLHLENYTSYVCKYSVKFSPDIMLKLRFMAKCNHKEIFTIAVFSKFSLLLELFCDTEHILPFFKHTFLTLIIHLSPSALYKSFAMQSNSGGSIVTT